MKTMKTLSRRIAALLLVVTVGITALAPAASASSIQLPSLPKDQCVVDDAGVLSDSTTSELEPSTHSSLPAAMAHRSAC